MELGEHPHEILLRTLVLPTWRLLVCAGRQHRMRFGTLATILGDDHRQFDGVLADLRFESSDFPSWSV